MKKILVLLTVIFSTNAHSEEPQYLKENPRACLVEMQSPPNKTGLPIDPTILKKCKEHDILVLLAPKQDLATASAVNPMAPWLHGNLHRICDSRTPIDTHASYDGREAVICQYLGYVAQEVR